MRKFTWVFAAGALLAVSAPALAHERSGGNYAYSYPSYRYASNSYGNHNGTNYGDHAGRYYPSRGWGYYRWPTAVYRQGPPYGRAWGYRRNHQVTAWNGGRNSWYGGRSGWYGGGNGDSRSCDRDGNRSDGRRHNHDRHD